MKIRQQRNPQEPKVRVWFSAPPELIEEIKAIAYRESKSISLVVRELIEAGLRTRRGNDA